MNPFKKASGAFKLANPHLYASGNGKVKRGRPRASRRGRMNKTESEFALRLLAMKQQGEIYRYDFEGITLRWVDMRYTPDFVVIWHSPCRPFVLKFIEVKGEFIRDRDIVRFKGARAFWPEFTFEMHQKTKDGWRQIY